MLFTNRYSMRPIEGLRRVADAALGQHHFMAVGGVLRPQFTNVRPAAGGVPTLVALCERALQEQVDIRCAYVLHTTPKEFDWRSKGLWPAASCLAPFYLHALSRHRPVPPTYLPCLHVTLNQSLVSKQGIQGSPPVFFPCALNMESWQRSHVSWATRSNAAIIAEFAEAHNVEKLRSYALDLLLCNLDVVFASGIPDLWFVQQARPCHNVSRDPK
jgi:hypothetical protein